MKGYSKDTVDRGNEVKHNSVFFANLQSLATLKKLNAKPRDHFFSDYIWKGYI